MMHGQCQSCEVLMINGLRCHEHGCPDAWGEETRECKWCGQQFKPKEKWQDCCDEYCAAEYHG